MAFPRLTSMHTAERAAKHGLNILIQIEEMKRANKLPCVLIMKETVVYC